MGINELLKVLKPVIDEKHISYFKDKTAAIDIMAWIYKGVYASAVDFGKGIDSDIYLNFPIKMLAMLKANGIKGIVVFDGKVPKAKQAVIENRKEYKDKCLETAKALLSEGKEEESQSHFRRALNIKSKMLNTLVEIIKKLKFEVVVAPYEADAQIAYLCKSGIADFAISEDSDLIPYGVKKVLYKLTSEGYGQLLDFESLEKRNLDSFPCAQVIVKLTPLQLVEVCVMSGCDYLASIKGFGIKTALKLFEKFENIERVIHNIKLIKKFVIPHDYLENAKKVVGLFFMQTIFDPLEGKLKSLTELNIFDSDGEKERKLKETLKRKSYSDEGYFGEEFENYKAFCKGELDFKTMGNEKKTESEEIIKKYISKFTSHFNDFKGTKSNNNKFIKRVNISQHLTLNKPNLPVNNITNNIAINNIQPVTNPFTGKQTYITEDEDKLNQIQFEEYNGENPGEFENLVKENDIEMQRFIQDSVKKQEKKEPSVVISPNLNLLKEIDRVVKTPKKAIDLSDSKPKSLFDLIEKEKVEVSSSPSKLMFSPLIKQAAVGSASKVDIFAKSPSFTQTTLNMTPRKYSEMNPKALDFNSAIANKKFK
jgi:exonuclease-1